MCCEIFLCKRYSLPTECGKGELHEEGMSVERDPGHSCHCQKGQVLSLNSALWSQIENRGAGFGLGHLNKRWKCWK